MYLYEWKYLTEAEDFILLQRGHKLLMRPQTAQRAFCDMQYLTKPSYVKIYLQQFLLTYKTSRRTMTKYARISTCRPQDEIHDCLAAHQRQRCLRYHQSP